MWPKFANPSTGGPRWETQPGVEIKEGFVKKMAAVPSLYKPVGLSQLKKIECKLSKGTVATDFMFLEL